MYVRKFEADSLEEALRNIKKELGPDAIILKTITNKGLKGVFKKSKVEIEAAISEKDYSKKSKVDSVLNVDEKDSFYKNRSSYISSMLNQAEKRSTQDQVKSFKKENASYKELGLNKQITTNVSRSNNTENLDEFLSSPRESNKKDNENLGLNQETSDEFIFKNESRMSNVTFRDLESSLSTHKLKIDLLEKKIFELSKEMETLNKSKGQGTKELVSVLRSLDLQETYIQKLVKKSNFEFSQEQLEEPDIVFEFALREMMEEINVDLPMFSSVEKDTKTITIVLSETGCGQTTVLTKIASLKKDSIFIRNKNPNYMEEKHNSSENFFGIEVNVCEKISEIVAAIRKGIEANKNIFIDYKDLNLEVAETKKFIDGLKRSFDNVEVLICISAIHSELYNRKILNRYLPVSEGIVVTYLDQCLNYGSLFNLAIDFNTLPYKFFGTGSLIPDDIESASPERILGGIFQL